MLKRAVLITLFLALMPASALPQQPHSYRSQYAGEESREIKSLSAADIEELKNGRGWGLAKAAELNGIPGPAHLLEMKDEIALSTEQVRKIETLFQEMKKEAIPLGLRLINLERRLNNHFADGTITEELLSDLLANIADVQKKLRYVHLNTHLKTRPILTPPQLLLYNRLRGYNSDDPCQNIPKGHDPEMWKRHNNCP